MLWLQLRKLKSADGEVRAQAAHALAGRGNPKAVKPLGEALEDRAWEQRAAAAMALGKLANGRGAPFLTAALRADPDVDVRCSCAWALGCIGGKGVIEALDAALQDDSDAVRRVAAEALGEVGTATVLESLERALGDAHHDVRLAAVSGLGGLRSGHAAPPLLGALHDSEWSVSCAAAEALAKIEDSTAVPALVDALANGSLAARLAASEALGRIGDPRAVTPLVEALGDLEVISDTGGVDVRLRRNVAHSLGAIGKAEGIGPLGALVTDRYTAGAAVEALVKVLRWDADGASREELQRLAECDDPHQVPWMVDEAEEARSGRVVVREGKPWPVDAADLRVAALAELRRREP